MAERGVTTGQVVNAAKDRLEGDKALGVIENAKKLVVAKGKKVVAIDLVKAKPGRDELLALLLGPSGNLRAPTWIKGSTVVVGFSPEAYADVLKV